MAYGRARAENVRDKLERRHVVLAAARRAIFGVAHKVQARHAQPALVDCVVVERVVVGDARHADYGVVVLHGTAVSESKNSPPRRDYYLLAVRTTVVERPPEIKPVARIRCRSAHKINLAKKISHIVYARFSIIVHIKIIFLIYLKRYGKFYQESPHNH